MPYPHLFVSIGLTERNSLCNELAQPKPSLTHHGVHLVCGPSGPEGTRVLPLTLYPTTLTLHPFLLPSTSLLPTCPFPFLVDIDALCIECTDQCVYMCTCVVHVLRVVCVHVSRVCTCVVLRVECVYMCVHVCVHVSCVYTCVMCVYMCCIEGMCVYMFCIQSMCVYRGYVHVCVHVLY